MTILKVKTSGVTTFLIDPESNTFMRVRGVGSNEFWHDHQWHRAANTLNPTLGNRMEIDFRRLSEGWHLTSAITEITEITKAETNAFIKERIIDCESVLLP